MTFPNELKHEWKDGVGNIFYSYDSRIAGFVFLKATTGKLFRTQDLLLNEYNLIICDGYTSIQSFELSIYNEILYNKYIELKKEQKQNTIKYKLKEINDDFS